MRDIILSVRPQWLARMRAGGKLEEVRKNKPLCGTPFRCLLYCTSGGEPFTVNGYNGSGTIVGSFVCRTLHEYARVDADLLRLSERSGVSIRDLQHYFGRKATIYGWEISELQFYDSPRLLWDYGLRRPPQSWGYMMEKEKTENER